MDGNDKARCKDDCSSSVEMDLYESNFQENDETLSDGEAYRSIMYFHLWFIPPHLVFSLPICSVND